MKTSKRILSILLTLAMACGLMFLVPLTSSALNETIGYTLYLGDGYKIGTLELLAGTFYQGEPDLVNSLLGGLLGGLNIFGWNIGSAVSTSVVPPQYVASSTGPLTLRLSGCDFTSSAAIALMLPKNTAVSLEGGATNKIASTFSRANPCAAFVSEGITVSGNGDLEVTGGPINALFNSSVGMNVGDITIKGNANVYAKGGANALGASIGLSANNVVVEDDAVLKAEGYAGARHTYGIMLGDGGSLTINEGGTVEAIGTSGAIYPAYLVPQGYEYYVNKNSIEPSDEKLISDGTVVIDWKYKYAKIVYAEYQPPEITTATLPNGAVDVEYNAVLAATGTPAFDWYIATGDGELPPGLDIDVTGLDDKNEPTGRAPGTIFGTPTQAGTYTFTLSVTNVTGVVDTKEYTIVIAPEALGPTITTLSLPVGYVGDTYEETIEATGDPTITWEKISGSLPLGLSLSADGEITGEPEAVGRYTFTVKATNDTGSATKVFTIVIAADPEIPVITTDQMLGGTVGVLYNQGMTFTAEGTATITWSYTGALPPGLMLDAATGVISGTPTAKGTYPFTIRATNAAGYGEKDLSIVIVDPPVVCVKYVRMFGCNTRYVSNFWNWFKFIVLFGWIWMWFI